MGTSLKVKLTALISLLVLGVVLVTSVLYLVSFMHQTLEGVQQIGAYIRDETYSHARAVVSATRIPSYIDRSDYDEVRAFVQYQLIKDPGMRALMQSAVAYSATVDYVAITGEDRVILAHNDPNVVGDRLPPAPSLNKLLHAGLLHQLRLLYGPPRVYEVVLPLEMNGQPFCDIRVGLSTVFLGAQVRPHLEAALELAILVIVIATLTAGLLSFRLLRPMATISQSVDRMARGEFSEPVRLKHKKDEWGILSSKLSLLGEQIRGEKAAYLALKDNLDQLFANLTDGLLLFDNQDKLVVVTPFVSRFLERPVDKLVHQAALEVFAGEGPLHQLLREAFREKASLSGRMVDLPDNPSAPRVSVTTHFVRERGHAVASLVLLRDTGTRAQLEDQIGVAAKLAALGRITSGVAHEVKNPLNAMILQVEILRSKLFDRSEQVAPQLDVLSQEIRRLDRVVKTFLDFTKPLEIRRTETSVIDLVREVFVLAEPQARKFNVKLVLEPNGALPPLNVDRDLVKQALLNLVLNGCQAMPQGGELRVSPHAEPGGIGLEIADQGVGIREEDRQRIFSLFHTTKKGGSGIGLAMAFRIVQLHDGLIEFTSEVNHGTTFRVSFPI